MHLTCIQPTPNYGIELAQVRAVSFVLSHLLHPDIADGFISLVQSYHFTNRLAAENLEKVRSLAGCPGGAENGQESAVRMPFSIIL